MAQPRIFISYRRGDSAPYAGRLNDRLGAAYGRDRVFVDIDDIAPGENFATVLRSNVEAASVVLVLIGSGWLSARRENGEEGSRRLDDERDYVRFEVAEALRAGKRVIPVLLNGTAMPQAGDLPSDLQALVFCQALQLSDAHFDRDVASLIQALGGKRSVLSLRILTIGFVLLAAILAGWLFYGQRTQDISEKTVQASVPVPQPAADIAGTWQGEVVYEWDNSKYTERFQFKLMAGVVTGTASFLTVPRGIQAMELKGNTISFETHTKGSMGDKEINYVHRYRGQVEGNTMRLVMQTTGGYDAAVPREIVAQRVNRE